MTLKKEIVAIFASVLILSFLISLMASLEIFLQTALLVFLVVIINVFAKKIAAFYFDSEIEIKIWDIERYGWMGVVSKGFKHPSGKFKKPILIGLFLPFLVSLFSYGATTWLATLVFEAKSKTYRVAKRFENYSFSEMSEFHIGWIAAFGIIANLTFGVIGYLFNFPEFAKLNLYLAFFNIIPISSLDGNKIFFGSYVLWGFLASIVLLGLIFGIFII